MKINVRTLVDLKQNTVSGNLTEKDLDHLSNYSDQVKEKVREYRINENEFNQYLIEYKVKGFYSKTHKDK